MPYLILDPTDEYAAHQMRFLDRLGLEAVLLFSSNGHRALWHRRYADELCGRVLDELVVDREDVAATADAVRERFPDGVFGLVVWDERHVLLAADLSEALDLDWNTREVIERFRDKSLMKACLREHPGIRVNRSRVVANREEALAFRESVGTWPVVVKPSGGAGSMSVYFAGDDDDLLSACGRVEARGLGEVLLEEYVGGDEYAVNGIADHEGGVLVADVWRYDRRDSHGERNVYFETWKLGSREEPFADIAIYASEVIRALGLRRSPFHMEVKVDDDGPCLIEVGARFAGGNQVTMSSKLHLHSMFELAACHYLDDIRVSATDVDYERYDALAACIVSGVQEHEIPQISAVLGVDEVRALPSFSGIGMLRSPGKPAPVSRDVQSKAWEVYLLHPEREQVEADAHAARELLRYI